MFSQCGKSISSVMNELTNKKILTQIWAEANQTFKAVS